MAEKGKGGTSPVVWVMGAAGLLLIVIGLSKLGPTKAKNINAKFEFDHVGPATDVKYRVRFGSTAPLPFGVFNANPDLVKETGSFPIVAHEVPTPVVANVKIVVPAKENSMYFPLPYTYDGEAMILDAGGNLVDGGKVVTENVFTHTKEFEVQML